MLGLVIVLGWLGLALVVATRAKKSGRKYWGWFAAAVVFGPLGAVIVLLVLEASNHKRREMTVTQGDDT